MYDVITIGSSVIDSFIKSKAFTLQESTAGVHLCQAYGEKLEVDEYVVRTGGGGSNTAVGFARMGFRTAVITEVGTDVLAKMLVDDFHSERVSTNYLIAEKTERTGGSIILLGADGGRTILTHRGAAAQLDPKDVPAQALRLAKWVHLASIAGNIDTLKAIFTALKQNNTNSSWNPGKAEIELLRTKKLPISEVFCTAFFVNRQEWQLLGPVQQQILSHISLVVITDGGNGGYVFQDGKPAERFLAQSQKAVDETGAGDAFIVGFVSAWLRKQELSHCVQWGVQSASSVVLYLGAKQGLLTTQQLISHNEI